MCFRRSIWWIGCAFTRGIKAYRKSKATSRRLLFRMGTVLRVLRNQMNSLRNFGLPGRAQVGHSINSRFRLFWPCTPQTLTKPITAHGALALRAASATRGDGAARTTPDAAARKDRRARRRLLPRGGRDT